MATVELGASASRSPSAAGKPLERRSHAGLVFEPVFCPADVADPFDTTEWEVRTAAIKGENGEVLFEQTDCEVPVAWSQLATNVVVSKYFYGEVNTPQREHSVRQLVHRVSRTIADWGKADGYFASEADGEQFYRDLTWLCLHQHGAFNSPVWFNVGLYHQYGVGGAACNWYWDAEARAARQPRNPYEYPQGSACFIQSVTDNMEDIMRLATSEAMLFKFGSGTGTDLSTLRSHREKLSGGGKPSGPLSFMRVYDQIAAVVKSGGKTRRAAKMQSLKVWHPDIMEFIECKAKEEAKAHCLIEKGGYEANFNGEAYSSIMFQNANLSVRLTDEFMNAVANDEQWSTHWVTDPNKPGPSWPAREVLDRMASNAWKCGDPGVQYDTTINNWHTCPTSGRINASNPCVTGDTLISTSDGLVSIAWLEGQTPDVVGSDGNLHSAVRVIKTGRRQICRLTTACGYELKLTPDHRVLTKNRGDVPASELRSGDRISLGRVNFGRESLDGNVSQQLGRILASGEKNVAKALERAQEKSIGSFGAYAGVVTAIDGVCEHLVCLDRESAANVIRAMFEAQGSRIYPVFNSNSHYAELQHLCVELLRQIQLLLLGFGIVSRVSAIDEELSIQRLAIQYTPRFQELIEGSTPLVPTNWSAEDRVVSGVEPLGEDWVYDLTEPDTSHFVANGIVVHNCSEYMFLDDTACNLSSINLMKFRRADGTFDVARFRHACRVFFVAQEILVDHASYPTQRIAENSHRFRPLGLGYSNLGSLLMTGGVPYDSDQGYGICGAITALLHGAANLASSEMAEVVGPFDGYEVNEEPMLRVMQMHRDAVERIDPACPAYLKTAARGLWEEVLVAGTRHGFRNAQATVLAPTGTISFLMDCDTTGIEPDIALVKYKQLAGGGMLKLVNQTVPLTLSMLGYEKPQIEAIIAHIDKNDKIEGAPHLRAEHLPVFDCAFEPPGGGRSINWRAHVRMMAAAQPFLSGAISKTVNMPESVTSEDVAEAYTWGWRLGLKALAIYRDGSKRSQPLSTSSEGDKAAKKVVAAPRRERLPDTRYSITHKFSVDAHEGYLCVGLYDDGRPGELFITMAKEGSTIGGMMDSFGTAVSMSLQYGVPLEVLVKKFSHTRFDPMGYTKNPDIRYAKSIVDYIFRWMGNQFIPGYREASLGLPVDPRVTVQDAAETSDGEEETALLPAARKAGGPAGPGSASGESFRGSAKQTVLAPGESPGVGPGGQRSTPAAKKLNGANGNGAHGTHGNGHTATETTAVRLARAGVAVKSDRGEIGTLRSAQFAEFQKDAPLCDTCGAITVRNGNCYLCYGCGNSMGCS